MAVGAICRPTDESFPVAVSESATGISFVESPSGRIPALDGLRGIAILLVLLWHGVFQIQTNSRVMTRLLSWGSLSWSGVDLFFVLSGFLIGGILLDAKDSSRYFRTFYVRRAYRILPLYAVLLLAQAVSRLSFLPRSIAQFSPDPVPFWSYVTFSQNIWMAAIAGFGSLVMTATWSLAIEEQFYLTVPILIRKLSRSILTKTLLVVILAAPALRTFLYFSFRHGGFASYVLMPCRADDLCLGVLAAIITRNQELWRRVVASRRAFYALSATLTLPLGYFCWRQYGPYSGPMVTVGYSLLGLFYTSCLLVALTADGKIRRTLCDPRLMKLGTLAYCTYLLHLPLIEFFDRLFKHRWSVPPSTIDLAAGLLGITLTLFVATFSWKYFERPFLRRGQVHKY